MHTNEIDIITKQSGGCVIISDPFAKRLMAHYLGRRKADLASLRSSLSRRDFDSIRVKGHNLYGSGCAYGLDPISQFGSVLECAAKAEDSDQIQHTIESLETYLYGLKIA